MKHQIRNIRIMVVRISNTLTMPQACSNSFAHLHVCHMKQPSHQYCRSHAIHAKTHVQLLPL